MMQLVLADYFQDTFTIISFVIVLIAFASAM